MRRITLAGAAALFLLTTPADATAGTYKAIQCYEQAGAGHHDAAFTSSSERYEKSSDCKGKGLGITHDPGSSPTGSGRYGAWTLTAPAGTEITRAAARVSAQSQNWHVPQLLIGLDGGARDLLDGVRGDLHTVDWEGTGGRSLSSRLACLNRRECGDGRDAHIYMRRIALTLRDLTSPTIQLGGSLLEPGSKRGNQVLEVAASDSGSGIRSVTVELNEEPLEARVLECSISNDVAVRLRPCPSSPTPRFDISTAAADFRQGPNELRVCASDYAPQATANRTCESRTVRVDNACPVSDVPGEVLRARFKGAGDRLTATSDATPIVTGVLTDDGGDPVRGAEVCVATRVKAGNGPSERVIATPITDADGRFSTRLPAGPSREVRIAHWRDPQHVSERFLELGSRAVPRLALSPDRPLRNGDSVRFDVRIPGPANGGKRVAVQARASGRWIRIDGGRTDRGGHWRGSYRFRSTTGTRRYAFRAVVPRQSGYPYAAGHSETRRATVSGP